MLWRSDCLVQAMAAQNWLKRKGIPTSIVIGVDKSGDEGSDAYAWLRAGDLIVTDGNIDNFTVILDDHAEFRGKIRNPSP
ncbi:lasso peptide biosynthesis B2 protein [Aurantiacibacter zhengii]|uniref:Lasso peptide biosynthesis B2 protein n=1 Tax=Aurantiacibacter zhengii TaxID=2307003 RepID=A0A418NNQ2_9SPHN|nr:lasso peptide biosynthesis B2 protein [Aurantiacibacter zhengii]RIV83057.1 lasso peptide biosynthesis B2 protein [Aurantiacibacter zhengii]